MSTALPDEVRELLQAPNIAHVATVMPDGMPHSVPTWISTTDDGARPVFLTGPGSQKARNLDRDPRVSISLAAADDPGRMVHIRGRVVEVVDGDEGWRIIDRIAQAYIGAPYPRELDRAVYVVEPEHAVRMDFG